MNWLIATSFRVLCSILGLFVAGAAWAAPITVSYTATPEFAGVFVAKERGLFAKRGLDVTLQLIPVAPNVPAALVSDSIQIGGTTPSVLLQAVDSGIDLVAVAGGGIFDVKGKAGPIGIAAKQGTSITRPQDLSGRKLGVPGIGAAIDLLSRRWLRDAGVDLKQVTFVEVPIPQMADVLKGGSVDAVAVPEPFLSRIVQAQIGNAVPSFAQSVPDAVSTVLYVASRNWAASNGAAVKAFRDALMEASGIVESEHESALRDIGKYIKVPPPVLRASPYPKLAPALKDEQLRFWSDLMRTQDMLKRQVPLSSVILK